MVVVRWIKDLFDHLGRKVEAAPLREEIAGPTMGGVRDILSGHPEVGMDPVALAGILRAAEEGDPTAYLELAEAMEEKDLHYLGVLGTRKRAVAQLPINIEAGGEDAKAEEIAQFIRDWLSRDSLEDELFDILDAIGKGYSVSEIIWETRDGKWVPTRLKWRDPRWFQFDRTDGETLRLRDGTWEGAALPPFKFVVHLHKAKSGLPIRGGLARAAAWAYLFKNYSLKDWVAFAEIYGLPFRIGKYDPGASEGDKRALLRAVTEMGSDAAGIIPSTTQIEFKDGSGGNADGALFKNLNEYLDQQMSKAVLGQTATTDATSGGLGGSQGNVHNDVRGDIERADAKLLGATLNQQMIKPMVDLNFGPQKVYPKAVIGREESVDLKAAMEAAEKAADMGVEVPVSYVRKLTRIPEPKGGEAVLTPAAKAAPAGEPALEDVPANDPDDPKTKTGRKARQTPEDDQDASAGRAAASMRLLAALRGSPDPIDGLADHALADWVPDLGPAVVSIEERLAACATLQEAEAVLAGLVAELDVSAMADRLARAGFVARMAGKLGVPTIDEDGQ